MSTPTQTQHAPTSAAASTAAAAAPPQTTLPLRTPANPSTPATLFAAAFRRKWSPGTIVDTSNLPEFLEDLSSFNWIYGLSKKGARADGEEELEEDGEGDGDGDGGFGLSPGMVMVVLGRGGWVMPAERLAQMQAETQT